jgi:hypothetical protein
LTKPTVTFSLACRRPPEKATLNILDASTAAGLHREVAGVLREETVRRQSRNLRTFWLIALALILGQATGDSPAQSNGREIRSVALSSNGKTLATGLESGQVSATAPLPSGNAILVVTNPANPFSGYYQESLRTEGLNVFSVIPIGSVTPTKLGGFDVVILSAMALNSTQAGMFTDWVTSGGNLIAMWPDKKLATLLGLTGGSTLSEGYLLMDTSKAPSNDLVNQTIQSHGTADRYTASGDTRVAVLYSNATTATPNPAVTLDLARSLILTRQGNPPEPRRNAMASRPYARTNYGNAIGDRSRIYSASR